jgi:hypothetical protein
VLSTDQGLPTGKRVEAGETLTVAAGALVLLRGDR